MLIGLGKCNKPWFWRKMFGGNWLLTWPFWKNGVLWSLSSLQLNLDSSDPPRACNSTPTTGLRNEVFWSPPPLPLLIFYLVWDWLFGCSVNLCCHFAWNYLLFEGIRGHSFHSQALASLSPSLFLSKDIQFTGAMCIHNSPPPPNLCPPTLLKSWCCCLGLENNKFQIMIVMIILFVFWGTMKNSILKLLNVTLLSW